VSKIAFWELFFCWPHFGTKQEMKKIEIVKKQRDKKINFSICFPFEPCYTNNMNTTTNIQKTETAIAFNIIGNIEDVIVGRNKIAARLRELKKNFLIKQKKENGFWGNYHLYEVWRSEGELLATIRIGCYDRITVL
jgi:hypothetical protein